MTTTHPMCLWCRRFRMEGLVCTSFPRGIPDQILEGAPHYVPLADEPTFLAIDRQAAETVARLWPLQPAAR